MIINLPTKRIRVTNISKNFTHKMAAETSWNEITSLSTMYKAAKPQFLADFNAVSS